MDPECKSRAAVVRNMILSEKNYLLTMDGLKWALNAIEAGASVFLRPPYAAAGGDAQVVTSYKEALKPIISGHKENLALLEEEHREDKEGDGTM